MNNINVNISTKNFELSQSTKNIITDAVAKKLGSFDVEPSVTVSQEGRRVIVKISMNAYDSLINATGDDIKLIRALTDAIDIAKRKVRRAKTQAKKPLQTTPVSESSENEEFVLTKITSEKHILVDTLTDGQAAYAADMSDRAVFHYRDENGCMAALVRNKGSFTKIIIE